MVNSPPRVSYGSQRCLFPLFSSSLSLSHTQHSPLTKFISSHTLTTLSICHSHLLQYNTISLNNITPCILMHNNLYYTIGQHFVTFLKQPFNLDPLSLKHHTISNNSKHILIFSSPHQVSSCNNCLNINRNLQKNLHIL